jgi:hypothetical protein
MATNTLHSESVPATAPDADSINLEHISADLGTIKVFVEALENFICDLQAIDPAKDDRQALVRHILQVDTMAFEIKTHVTTAKNDLDDFISATPASHHWAERAAA